MKINVSLIGCGAVSKILYVPVLNSLIHQNFLQITSIIDPNDDNAKEVARSLAVEKVYPDIKCILDELTPHLAIIATPHKYHCQMSVDLLRKGVNVLCEKPMAVNLSECNEMIKASQETGKLLAVGHFRRFFSSCQLIKNIIDTQSLGSVVSFQFLEGETYSWPVRSTSFFKRSEAGGGVLIDAGVHLIDLLLWWLGDVAELNYQDDAMGGVETNCRLHLKMTNGSQGIVQLSRDWPLPNCYTIKFEKGWLRYNCDVVDKLEWGFYNTFYGIEGELRQLGISFNGTPQLGKTVPNFMGCFNAQLQNVIRAIQGIEPLSVSGKDASKSIGLIEQCYNNRSLLPMPWLEQAEIQTAKELSYV